MVKLPWEILYTTTLYNCCTASPHVLSNSEALSQTQSTLFWLKGPDRMNLLIFSHVSLILIIICGFYVYHVSVSSFLTIFGQMAKGNRKYPMSHSLAFNLHMTSTHPPADKLQERVGELTKSSAKTAWHQVNMLHSRPFSTSSTAEPQLWVPDPNALIIIFFLSFPKCVRYFCTIFVCQ